MAGAMSSLLLLMVLLGSTVGICPLPHEGIVGEATIAALLALHRGPNCSRVELRGLQQAAALGLAVRRVNDLHAEAKDGLSIGLQVLDTCSDPEEAVKMALRSLVSSVQASHLPPPLFLGFLGPDEAATLDAVQKVTGVFKLSHVTPISLRGRVVNPLHVVALDPREKVKMILTLLRRLDWTSFSVVHAVDAVSSDVSRILASEASHSSEPMCVLSMLQLPTAYDAEAYESLVTQLAAAKRKGAVSVDLKGKQAAFAAAAAAAAAAGRGPPGVVIIGSLPGPIADFLRYVEVWGLSRAGPALPSGAAEALGGATPAPDEAAFVVSVSSTGLLPELAALQLGPSTSVLVVQDTVGVHSEDEEDEDEMDNEVGGGAAARPSIHRLADTVANSTLWPPYLLATRGCGASADAGASSVVSSCVDAVARSNVEEFYLVQDPSVVPAMDAVRLFSSALAVAHGAKCGARPGRCPELVSMSADEWRALLATAAVGGKSRKVHFQMRRESSAQVYSKTPADSSPAFLVGTAPGVRLRKVGNMTGGGELHLVAAFHFPVSHNAEGVKCVAATPPLLPTTQDDDAQGEEEASADAAGDGDSDDAEDVVAPKPPPPPPPPPPPAAAPKDEEEDGDGFGFTFDLLEALNGDNMWEVIGILTAAGIAILLVFACFIYAVYASFRVRTEGNGGTRSRGRAGTGRRPQRRGSGGSVESIQS